MTEKQWFDCDYITQLDGVALCDKTIDKDGFCDLCLKEKCEDIE